MLQGEKEKSSLFTQNFHCAQNLARQPSEKRQTLAQGKNRYTESRVMRV